MSKIKVAEIFGPTLQGEGPQVGMQCVFIRLGGCDYRCSWCDSSHAVLPALVNELPDMTEDEIVEQVVSKGSSFRWVVISGGNPLLWNLSELVYKLHELKLKVAVETQGTVTKPWIETVDFVVVSPKPPSSGMTTVGVKLDAFIKSLKKTPYALKVVAFDAVDVDFAVKVHHWFSDHLMYLSCGTFAPSTSFSGLFSDSTDDVLERTKALFALVSQRPSLADVRILPQMHVLLWGHKKGV